jgi:leader peptidase (prepilin peptidase) / N-methyltransferase
MVVLLTLVAGVLGWLTPAAIRRLPEPPADPQAEPDAVESELQRMLREEGPRPTYRSVAATRGLAQLCAVLSMVLAVASWYALDDHRVAGAVMVLTPVLVMLAVIDARTRLLPRLVVLPATAVLLALALVEWIATRHTHALVRELVAMLVARSVFWALWFVRQAGMGFGDVRLAALAGLVLGRIGWSEWIVGLYGGLLAFALFGVGLALVRRDRSTLKKAFPYGPFLVAGLYLGVLTSGSISLV